MKKLITAALFVAIFTACHKESPVYWDNIEITRDEAGVTALLNYPYRFGGNDSVTVKINNRIETFLKTGINEECLECSLDSALTVLIAQKQQDTVLFNIPYDFNAEGSVFQYGDVTSVRLMKTYYTGGANYNMEVTFLNFDSKTGDLLELSDLVNDIPALTELTRTTFFAQHQFTPEYYRDSVRISDMPEELPLAATIGLDSEGIVVFYNLYEIAPRSFGATELKLPYSAVESLLKIKKDKDK